MSEIKTWSVFLGWISVLAFIPAFIWYIILTLIAWSLNQSGLTGEWVQNTVQLLHYWKYWWCLGVFILAFIGQVLVVIGGRK